jgi:hypothetical protein
MDAVSSQLVGRKQAGWSGADYSNDMVGLILAYQRSLPTSDFFVNLAAATGITQAVLYSSQSKDL